MSIPKETTVSETYKLAGGVAESVAAPAHGFGERVRALRTERDWSLEKLAELSGLHRTAIGLIERGERDPSLTTAMAIAKAFGVPLDDLVALTGVN